MGLPLRLPHHMWPLQPADRTELGVRDVLHLTIRTGIVGLELGPEPVRQMVSAARMRFHGRANSYSRRALGSFGARHSCHIAMHRERRQRLPFRIGASDDRGSDASATSNHRRRAGSSARARVARQRPGSTSRAAYSAVVGARSRCAASIVPVVRFDPQFDEGTAIAIWRLLTAIAR